MTCMVLPCADMPLTVWQGRHHPLLCLQISESLKRFGVQPDTKHLLVCRFDATDTDVSCGAYEQLVCQFCCIAHCINQSHNLAVALQRAAIEAMVQGEAVGVDSLPELRNTAAIAKVRHCPAL